MSTRRQVLIGAAALATTGASHAAAAGAGAGLVYDYLFVETPRRVGGTGGAGPFIAHLKAVGIPAVTSAGGEPLGYVTPLIGWSTEQLAVMIRWPTDAGAARERAVAAVVRHPTVATAERHRLAPTLRPVAHDLPKTTGIYTHRWFEIRDTDLAEFVALSGAAWPDFERDFDAKVFGLFRAEQTAGEARRGVVRMLLNTQYASHAVWEASRTPSAKAARMFQRRGDLTLTTRVASLRFTPLTVG